MDSGDEQVLTERRIRELGARLEDIMRRHPEADRDTVWRFLRDLELTPMERLTRALSLGHWSVSGKTSPPPE